MGNEIFGRKYWFYFKEKSSSTKCENTLQKVLFYTQNPKMKQDPLKLANLALIWEWKKMIVENPTQFQICKNCPQ